jgi:tetratricopeptide (TPR) repeat protein
MAKDLLELRHRSQRRLRLVSWAVCLLAALGYGGYVGGWHIWAHSHYRAARRAAAARDFAQARAHFSLCLDVWPDSVATRLQAARAAWCAGAYDEAEHHLDRCERLRGPTEAILLERALLRAQHGEPAGVEAYLLPRLKKGHSETELILEALIQGYLKTSRFPEALTLTPVLLQRRPDHSQAWLWQGKSWEGMHQYAPAERSFRQALALDPESDEAQLRRAECVIELSRTGEAREPLEALYRRQPGNGGVIFALARCRLLLGQLEEAGQLLDLLLDFDPRDVPALTERGRLALEMGRLDEAEGWLRRALELSPKNYDANYCLYLCLQRRGKHAEARNLQQRVERVGADMQKLADVARALAKSPRDLALRCDMGELFLRIGQDQEGVQWLNGVLQQAPRYRAAHLALADYYANTGKPALAKRHRREAAGQGAGTGSSARAGP